MSEKSAAAPSEIFAQRVREARNRLNWKQTDLANELDRLGYPMDRTTIARLENNDRKVSLNDFMAICIALSISPLHMLIPVEEEGEEAQQIAAAPEYLVDRAAMARWVKGDMNLPGMDAASFARQMPDEWLKKIMEERAQRFIAEQPPGALKRLNEILVEQNKEEES